MRGYDVDEVMWNDDGGGNYENESTEWCLIV